MSPTYGWPLPSALPSVIAAAGETPIATRPTMARTLAAGARRSRALIKPPFLVSDGRVSDRRHWRTSGWSSHDTSPGPIQPLTGARARLLQRAGRGTKERVGLRPRFVHQKWTLRGFQSVICLALDML